MLGVVRWGIPLRTGRLRCFHRFSSTASHPRHRAYRIQLARDDHPPTDLAELGGRHSNLTPSISGPKGHDCDEAGTVRPDRNVRAFSAQVASYPAAAK